MLKENVTELKNAFFIGTKNKILDIYRNRLLN